MRGSHRLRRPPPPEGAGSTCNVRAHGARGARRCPNQQVRTWIVVLASALWWAGVSQAQDSLLLELSFEGDRLTVQQGPEPRATWQGDIAEAKQGPGRFKLAGGFEITDDSLYLGDRVYPIDRLGHLEVVRHDSHVRVQIFDRGEGSPPPLRSSNVIKTSGALHIDTGRFVRGYVLNFGSDVEVSGEVNRSVVCVGGDVRVQDGGVVRGSVVAFGGLVHKSDKAFVYGDLYAGNQQQFRPRWYDEPGQDPVEFNMAFDYNRVTGGLAWAKVAVGPHRGYAPRARLEAGYAFGSELWHYRAGLVRDEWTGPLYALGFYRDTKDDDAKTIGVHENTLFALLFGLDYRDYYFAQGFQTQAGWAFSEHRRVTLAYVNESLSPLAANQEQWSLFNGGDFPRNYESLYRTGDTSFATDFSGRLAFFKGDVQFRLPDFVDRRAGNFIVDLDLEVSSPDVGSDFEYTRYGGQLTRIQPLWEHQVLRARLSLEASGGNLPATRYLYLGGIGNLRGFAEKEFFGDRRWFLNAEYGWSFGAFECFGLYDAGQVVSGGGFDQLAVLHDVGLGVQIQNTLRVQVAADARFERAALVTFRFTRPF